MRLGTGYDWAFVGFEFVAHRDSKEGNGRRVVNALSVVYSEQCDV